MKNFLAVAAFFLITTTTLAQTTAEISLSTIPADPAPGASVRIEAQSFGADLDQSNITWRYNGKVIDGGIGRKSITVTAPASGAVGTVAMTATGAGFDSTTETLILRPASIDLLWEAADSYTPPFYKGKALPTTNSLIRVTGIPSASAPKQMVYNWSRNQSALGASSGYGKSSLLFRNSELDPVESISLEAISGAFNGSASTSITPGDPSVVAYQKNEGFIDYANGESNTINTGQSGLVLRFEPYFFSTPISIARSLDIHITESDMDVTNDSAQNELYLTAPEGRGRAVFTVAINTIAYTLQQITRAFTINFN
ncbi:MAG TPA: hypothetical protein VGE18_03310 [Candidatus Paceibacterota bacterium]